MGNTHLLKLSSRVNFWAAGAVLVAVFFTVVSKAEIPSSPLIVLVPGYFNSLASGYEHENPNGSVTIKPYFSWTVVETLENRGYQVEVTDRLNPVGTIAENGAIVRDSLAQIAQAHPGQPLWIVAHSAGGLYTLQALNLQPDLPITKVVTLATPYQGVRLISRLQKILPGLQSVAKILNLESLIEFEENTMERLLLSMKWPEKVKWYAMGSHAAGCFLLSCAMAQRLSWVMTVSQKIIRSDSDGIVTLDSSAASDIHLPLIRWPDMDYGLEHWEMVQDYRIFRAIGVTNVNWIRDRQAQMYEAILNRLETYH